MACVRGRERVTSGHPAFATSSAEPPSHQTFQGRNFVICSFVPRRLDYDLQAVPIPYHHSCSLAAAISRRGQGRQDPAAEPEEALTAGRKGGELQTISTHGATDLFTAPPSCTPTARSGSLSRTTPVSRLGRSSVAAFGPRGRRILPERARLSPAACCTPRTRPAASVSTCCAAARNSARSLPPADTGTAPSSPTAALRFPREMQISTL